MKKKTSQGTREKQKRELQSKLSRNQPENVVTVLISPADRLHHAHTTSKSGNKATVERTGSSKQSTLSVQSPSEQSESRSKLDRTLWELLTDNASLQYYIQFMEHDGDVTLVQFWLAAESFRLITEERLRPYREPVRTIASNRKPATYRTALSRDMALSPHEESFDSHIGLGDSLTDLRSRQRSPWIRNSDDQRELLGLAKVALAPTDRLGQERKISARRKDAIMTADSLNDKTSRPSALVGSDMMRQQSKSAESDAMGLYEAYVSLLAEKPLPLDEQTRLQVERNICRDDGIIKPDSFQVAQDFVFQLMKQKYYPDFLRSQYMCRYQIEILTSGKFNLRDILFHDITMGYFMQFLDQEGAVHYLEFWLAANSVHEQLMDEKRRGTYRSDAAVADCMVLYDRYFSLQATRPLNFGDRIRVELEVNICREGGPLPSCFGVPQKIAFDRMETHFYNFLQSELHYQHLSDLLGVIRSDRSNTPRSSISEGSTGPSEVMSPEERVRTSFSSQLGVDCGENPDLLWQRRSRSLVIGRINERGIYESDIEEQLQRIARQERRGMRQRFSQAMKKLVGNEDKEKEEMAWKIAHMIVNSISQQVQQQEGIEGSSEADQTSSVTRSGLSLDRSSNSVPTASKI